MGIKTAVLSKIPGTETRRQVLLSKIFEKKLGDAEAIAMMEWPDGQVTFHQAFWDRESGGWHLDNDKMVYPKGKGGDPKSLNGVPLIQCHSEEMGVVSTEASLLAGAVDRGDILPIDDDGRPLAEPETGTSASPGADGDAGDSVTGKPVADGGVTAEMRNESVVDGSAKLTGQEADAVPDMPVEGLTWDAVEYSLTDAVEFDPNPVREEDARQAAEWAELSGRDRSKDFKLAMYGAAAATIIILALLGLNWLAGEVSDEGTGLTVLLPFILTPAGFKIRDVVNRVQAAASQAMHVPGVRWIAAATSGLAATAATALTDTANTDSNEEN